MNSRQLQTDSWTMHLENNQYICGLCNPIAFFVHIFTFVLNFKSFRFTFECFYRNFRNRFRPLVHLFDSLLFCFLLIKMKREEKKNRRTTDADLWHTHFQIHLTNAVGIAWKAFEWEIRRIANSCCRNFTQR